jgi:hypothetical protein
LLEVAKIEDWTVLEAAFSRARGDAHQRHCAWDVVACRRSAVFGVYRRTAVSGNRRVVDLLTLVKLTPPKMASGNRFQVDAVQASDVDRP